MILPSFFGGSLAGNVLNAVCFGVLTIQVSSYYHTFLNDRKPLKLAVSVLWAVQAYQLAGITWALYSWFVTNNENPLALERVPWEYSIYQFCTVITSVTVQTFFAHRLYSLSSNIYLGLLVEALVLLQFGFGATMGIKVDTLKEFELVIKECTWLVKTWSIIQVVVDLVIATCMVFLLRRRRTGFQNTDSVLNHMILYTINTGMLTSVITFIALGLFTQYGYDFGVIAITMPLGSCYAITMLANLHMRKTLREKLATPSALQLINYPIKKRQQQSAGDHGGATMVYVAREVVSDDGDINPTSHQTSDTKTQFTADQSLVWEAT